VKGAPIFIVYGQPGSGKTTLGKRLAAHLGTPFLIDGDEFRGLTNNQNFSRGGREANIRTANVLATYLSLKGFAVVLALVNPYALLRAELAESNPGQCVEVLLWSRRDLRREYHVKDFEKGKPRLELCTDEPVEVSWRDLEAGVRGG